MESLLRKSTGLVNLPRCTPPLTQPFSLCHAYQKAVTPEAIEKRRLRQRGYYLQKHKTIEQDSEATKQPWYTWWTKTRYSNDPAWRLARLESQKKTYDTTLRHDEVY
jgi:hypothetical protein